MNRFFAALALIAACAAPAFADDVSGVFEKGAANSVIFEVSPESGDVVGYFVKNDSAMGKRMIKECVPNMFCSLTKAKSKLASSTPSGKFSDSPSGWYEVTGAGNVAAISDYLDGPVANTRFGDVTITDKGLMHRGKPIKVVGDATYPQPGDIIISVNEVGDRDVILMSYFDSMACQNAMRFITVTAKGAVMSNSFGNCDYLVRSFPKGNDVIVKTTAGQGVPLRTYRYNSGNPVEQK